MEPQNYEYVRQYTLVGTIAIGVVLTIAAVIYAISGATSATDSQGVIDQVVQRACKPIDDKRGTIEYRTKVAGVMARRVAAIAFQRAGERR